MKIVQYLHQFRGNSRDAVVTRIVTRTAIDAFVRELAKRTSGVPCVITRDGAVPVTTLADEFMRSMEDGQ